MICIITWYPATSQFQAWINGNASKRATGIKILRSFWCFYGKKKSQVLTVASLWILQSKLKWPPASQTHSYTTILYVLLKSAPSFSCFSWFATVFVMFLRYLPDWTNTGSQITYVHRCKHFMLPGQRYDTSFTPQLLFSLMNNIFGKS